MPGRVAAKISPLVTFKTSLAQAVNVVKPALCGVAGKLERGLVLNRCAVKRSDWEESQTKLSQICEPKHLIELQSCDYFKSIAKTHSCR